MPDHKVHIVYQLGGGEQVATQATGQAMAVVVITKHHITRRLQSTGNVSVTAHMFAQAMQQQNRSVWVLWRLWPSVKSQRLLAVVELGDMGFLGRLVGNRGHEVLESGSG